MAETNSALHSAPTLGNRKELLLFGLSFVVFLVIALTGAEGVSGLFGGVKAAVYTFMSYVI
jgi:light-harvesting complex 1 beta chain